MNLNKTNRRAIIAIIVVTVLIFFMSSMRSGYLSPRDIEIETQDTGSLFDLPYKTECVPGPQKTADYYTRGLTPGGVCGGQDRVNKQANYKITGGIGGILL